MADLAMTRDDILAEIRSYIGVEFLSSRAEALGEGDPLVTSGLIDSAGVLEVVTWLEQRFEIRIDDLDVGMDNFNTLADLTAMVARKRA